MERPETLRALIDAAGELHARELWNRFKNTDCFALRLAGETDMVLASVMGDGGEQFGLSLFLGPDAAESFLKLTTGEASRHEVYETMDLVGFSMNPFGEMAPEVQAYFRDAGVHPKQGDLLPVLLVKQPHHQPRLPDASELRMLLAMVRATVRADRRKLLYPAEPDDPSGVCVVALDGEPWDPEVSVNREPLPLSPPTALAQPHVFAGSGVDLTGFKRGGAGEWVVGTPSLPIGVPGDARSMRMLLVVDAASGEVVEGMPFFSDELRSAIDQLTAVLEGKGLPSRITFASADLHEALRAPLEAAGVGVGFEPNHPGIDEVAHAFLEHLETNPGLLGGEEEDGDPDLVPAPDDLAGWKSVDERLANRFIDYLYHGDRPAGSRAIKRYFGDEDIAYFMEVYVEDGVAPGYASWCVLEYRPTRKSKTQAELMLEAGLPEPEAMLLRAKMRAIPSLYRVRGCDPEAGAVEFEDVLRGGVMTIHDQLLSENSDRGVCIPARVFEAGRFHFLETIGPPLAPSLGFEAVEFLRSCKLPFTDEGLKREAHKFGWLWGWRDDREQNPGRREFFNTDGERMVLHTASFTMADSAAVAEALRRREDIDYDEAAEQYVWNKPNEAQKLMGDFITLGRIELLDDELVLTLNSAERFDRALGWIEALPGVSFIDVRKRDANAVDREAAPDDQMPSAIDPSEMSPELIEQLQSHLEQHYMAWLDMELPVLGDKTPRQACRTAEGRAQVTALIRTMPDPMGDGAFDVPREAMLRALGLPSGAIAPADPEAGLAPEPASSAPKVGRNAPCPCGSGLKYKKCCGR